jgi:hypothetical protein
MFQPKAGDRVGFESVKTGSVYRGKGTVETLHPGGRVIIRDDRGGLFSCTPRQVRRLKKFPPPRRRIEAFWDDSGATWRPLCGVVQQDERVEFKEVKRERK